MKKKSFSISGLKIGNGANFFLIAGPCVIESEELTFEIAKELKKISSRLGIGLIFKASFDKANRSSTNSFRGPGLKNGLEVLKKIKKDLGLLVISDIHEPAQAEPAAKVLDVIQVPAFLARQTDLIIAAAKTKKPLHLKKAQFMAPGEMENVVKKALAGGADKIMLCERGTFFGYHNLVVDFRGLQIMAELGWPVVFDATHSVQRPAGKGQASGGDKKFIPLLCRAAVAAGVDGLFIETHPEPEKALSDGPNSWPLSELAVLLKSLITIKNAVGKDK